MSGFRGGPRKGENFELAADLNSEYKEKRKDAIKRVIANMTVQKGTLSTAFAAREPASSVLTSVAFAIY